MQASIICCNNDILGISKQYLHVMELMNIKKYKIIVDIDIIIVIDSITLKAVGEEVLIDSNGRL